VYYSGEWLSVCNTSSSSFGTEEASTVCRQLGYKLLNLTSRYYITSITTAYISCSDSWSNLNQCRITTTLCSSLYHPYIQCTIYEQGSLMLVGGSSSNQGRLEVYINGEWGTVCNDNWGSGDALVACRQLGYSRVSSYHIPVPGGPSSQRICVGSC
jgi:hypothetical protein